MSTTSNIGWAELTIDTANHRILREVDYSPKGKVECEIDFLDWHSAGAGSEVPLRIRLRFARQKFEVDCRFQWRDEGLWILKSGTAKFEGQPPQHETITELAINQPTPVLDDVLAQIERGDKELRSRSRAARANHAGRRASFRIGEAGRAAQARRREVVAGAVRPFHAPPTSRVFMRWAAYPDLIAEIGLPQAALDPNPYEYLLLTLLDESGYPLRAVRAPLAALSVCDRRFDDVVQAVRKHNAILAGPECRGISKPDLRLRQREAASRRRGEDIETATSAAA